MAEVTPHFHSKVVLSNGISRLRKPWFLWLWGKWEKSKNNLAVIISTSALFICMYLYTHTHTLSEYTSILMRLFKKNAEWLFVLHFIYSSNFYYNFDWQKQSFNYEADIPINYS
jgi:hypothetical protein